LKNLNEALLCFQAKSVSVHKNAKADRYKYADMAAVMDAVIEPLTECGLVMRQRTVWGSTTETTLLVTTLIHVASGESETMELPLYIDEKPQVFGSRLTYFRRYSILTLLGLAPEDDDGAAAMPPARASNDYDRRPAQDRRPGPDDGGLGVCRDCGAPNKLSKAGKPYCSALCFKRGEEETQQQRSAPPARRAPSRRDDDQYDEQDPPF
jgi:hypothetical protein